jgi:hypothetical protein
VTTGAVARVTPGVQTSQVFRIRGQKSRWRYPHPSVTAENCTVLNDVNLSERGVAESRNGFTKYNTTQLTGGEAVVGLWEGTFGSGVTKRVVVTPSKIYTDTGTARVNITGNALTGTADDRCKFAFLKDKLIINNGVDEPQVWAGDDTTPTAAADLTGIPFSKAVGMMVHKNLLFFAGTTESNVYCPTRLRWCDVNRSTFVVDITNWPIANRYEIYDGGPRIVGCVDNWGTAFIFKEDGLYPGAITFDQLGHYSFQLGDIKRGFSPISNASLVARPEFIFGAAREGLFMIDPSLNVTIVNSDDVNTWLGLNKARWKYTQAFVREKDHQVRLLCSSASNASGHDKILVFDWETGDTWLDVPKATMNFGERFTISDEELDWLGGYGGYLYKGNKGAYLDDAGAAFTWRVKMSPNDLGMPGIDKLILNVRTLYRSRIGSQTVNIAVHIDEGQQAPIRAILQLSANGPKWNSGIKWNSGVKWPSSGVRPLDTYVNRVCTTIEPEWYASSPANIEGYMVEFVPLEGMGE